MSIEAGVQARLDRCVTALTDKRQPAALDARLLAELKSLCRLGGDATVQLAWEATWPQLRAPHAQVRRRRRLPPALVCSLPGPRPARLVGLWISDLTRLQTRLLALLVCEYLFPRAAAFRRALCAQLSPFLEAVVGHRAERPLPPPAAAAGELRSKALELLEAWAAEHGGRHPQVGGQWAHCVWGHGYALCLDPSAERSGRPHPPPPVQSVKT